MYNIHNEREDSWGWQLINDFRVIKGFQLQGIISGILYSGILKLQDVVTTCLEVHG